MRSQYQVTKWLQELRVYLWYIVIAPYRFLFGSNREIVMTRVQRSLQLWQLLIGAARLRQTLTYNIAAKLIGMGAGTLSQPLDLLMRYCARNELPPLTVLVVNQVTGQPGAGLSTLEELNSDRELVFNYQWFRLPPLTSDDLSPQLQAGDF